MSYAELWNSMGYFAKSIVLILFIMSYVMEYCF